MFHNPHKLLRAARWLRIISWLNLIIWILLIGLIIQSLVINYPELPFVSSNYYIARTPGWQDWVTFAVNFAQQIVTPLGYFLLLQGMASAIQFLLKYYQRILTAEQERSAVAG